MTEKQSEPMQNNQNQVSNRFAIPVEVQIKLAEARRQIAVNRYQTLVRRGKGWGVGSDPRSQSNR